jgi:hypothetical protein
MYFLINKDDGSYNCHGEEPFPTFMLTTNVEQVHAETPPEYENITLLMYDFDTGVFSEKEGMLLLSEEELQAQMEARRLHQINVGAMKDAELFHSIIERLSPILTDEQLDLITDDNAIDSEEMADLQELLNG